MKRFITSICLTTATVFAAAPVFADEPGGALKVTTPVTGEQVYRQVCQACHMANAKGGTGAGTIPALANNPHLAVAAYPITIILKGKGAMPWFDDVLNPDQVANVTGYIRTHFGNAYAKPVTEADVVRLAGKKTSPQLITSDRSELERSSNWLQRTKRPQRAISQDAGGGPPSGLMVRPV